MRDLDYLNLMAREYPNEKAAVSEMINLRAIQALPKGTEYFFSDLHGEHGAFVHLLKSCSGVIKVKVKDTFGHMLTAKEETELANIIYYPERSIEKKVEEGNLTDEWISLTIYRLIQVLKVVSTKYTRSKVRKKMPPEFAYIIDELLHVNQLDENKKLYYSEILNSILDIGVGDKFIIAICGVIQRLTIDHLHILGDIYDRGPHGDIIMEELIKFDELDMQWGNHDAEWMGAAAGNLACVCSVLRVGISYNNFDILEDAYGINLRQLSMFASEVYKDDPCLRFRPHLLDENIYDSVEPTLAAKMHKAIAIIMFKVEGALVKRHPEYNMEGRLLLDKIDFAAGTLNINGKEYPMLDTNFPTVDPKDPYKLTPAEEELVESLALSFKHSILLQKHIQFMYSHGSMYLKYNNNLLFHGCIPMDVDGEFTGIEINGKCYRGKEFMDYLEKRIIQAYFLPEDDERKQSSTDLMYYLWCGAKSPLFGKDAMRTFENYFIEDAAARKEHMDPYYKLSETEECCNKIFEEFGLPAEESHIINGHIPVKIKEGQSPIKANGKLYVIDGGLSKAYQKKTGIGGYTLIFNSNNLSLAEHKPFRPEEDSTPKVFVSERMKKRILVGDTDRGKELEKKINDLKELRAAFQKGLIKEKKD